jgi:hypothetical protein
MNKKTLREGKFIPLTRSHVTFWFKDAAGYSEKYLALIKQALQKSHFPELNLEEVEVIVGGGCLSGSSKERFNGLSVYSNKKELRALRCLYKASEFSNLLHVSMIVYTLPAGLIQRLVYAFLPFLLSLPVISFFFRKKDPTLKEIEYAEVLDNLIGMAGKEAIRNLGVEPLHIVKGEMAEETSDIGTASATSGLGQSSGSKSWLPAVAVAAVVLLVAAAGLMILQGDVNRIFQFNRPKPVVQSPWAMEQARKSDFTRWYQEAENLFAAKEFARALKAYETAKAVNFEDTPQDLDSKIAQCKDQIKAYREPVVTPPTDTTDMQKSIESSRLAVKALEEKIKNE